MYIHDLLPHIIIEWGRREFPGYGRKLFGQRYYEYMVTQLHHIPDTHARQWLVDWLSDLFRRDNSKFSPSLFTRAVAAQRNYGASPVFVQRHLYYLAQAVKEIQDPAIHDFVRDWLADVVGRTNPAFKRSVWNQFCEPPKPTRPSVDQTDEPSGEIDEQYGAPGFGSRHHGGFGKKFLRNSHYRFIASHIHDVRDPMIKQHLVQWFEKIFKLDNPDFKPEAFESEIERPRYASAAARWQQRQFYFLAHEVCEIEDPHERQFITDWLADSVGRTNEHFNVERWGKFCNLPPEDYDRRNVAHYRAKARGDTDIPETPWQEKQRLERERATQLTPEEFHRVATAYGEDEVAGHDLVYLRKENGEYVMYDKTTGKEHWATANRA